MKRAAFSLAMIELASVTLLYFLGAPAMISAAVLLTVAAVICVVFRNRIGSAGKVIAVLLIGVLFCSYVITFNSTVVRRAENLSGKSGTVTCTVVEEPVSYRYYKVISVRTSGDTDKNSGICGKVRFSMAVSSLSGAYSADIGDVLSANVEFYRTDELYRASGLVNREYISARCVSAEIIGNEKSLYKTCAGIRRFVRNKIDIYLDSDSAALLKGILLGDVSDMSGETRAEFSESGVCHITAVSGMHLNVVIMMFAAVMSLFLGKRKIALLSFVPLVLFTAVTGFSPSVIRAAIMCGITLVGIVFARKPEGLNSLGVAISVMLIINPYYILSLSFELSCSATAGVILVSKYSRNAANRMTSKIGNRIVEHIVNTVISVFIMSVGAVVATLPFQIVSLGNISLIAPVASVLVCSAAAYAVIMGTVSVIACSVPLLSAVAEIPFFITRIIIEYILDAVKLCSAIPFSYIPFGSKIAVLWLGLCLALIGLWALLSKIGGVKTIVLLVSALLVISLWAEYFNSKNVVEVAVLGTKGFCTVVSTGNKAVIIGCGSEKSDSYIIQNHLKSRNIKKVEAVIVPTEAEICSGGLNALSEMLEPEIAYLPEEMCRSYSGFRTESRPFCNNDSFSAACTDFTAVSNEYGIAVLCRCFDRTFTVGCGRYDYGMFNVGKTDFTVTGRAIPDNCDTGMMIVAGMIDGETFALQNIRIIPTNEKTVSVKLKNERGITVYAAKV